jgi:hypothetical protein
VKTIAISFRLAVASLAFSCLLPVCGQTVIGAGPLHIIPLTNSHAGASTRSAAPKSTLLSDISSALPQPGARMHAGPVGIRPHLSYGIVHGTGTLRVPGTPDELTVHTLSPGVLLEIGKSGTINYTLSRVMYSSKTLPDATNHNLGVQANITRNHWNVGVNGAYGTNRIVLVETGGQTEEDTYSTGARIARAFGSRSELETNLSHSVRSANPAETNPVWTGAEFALWSTSTWIRYHLSKNLSIAVGFGFGYDDIDRSPDMSHSEPQVQLIWNPAKKLSVKLEGGLERRRTRAALAETQTNGRYSFAVDYNLSSITTITLGANQTIQPSYFDGRITQSTGWNASVRQRLLTRLFLSMEASQREIDYESALPTISEGRSDQYYSYNITLSTPVVQRGSIAVFFQRGRNRSNVEAYTFTSNQVGAELNYRF